MKEKKVRSVRIYSSLDTFGAQAEYIRHGLQFDKFTTNVDRYLTNFPKAYFSIMSTFNALSLVGYQEFLKWYLQLRRQYDNQHRDLFLDIPHLTSPAHQSVKVLTPDYLIKMKKILSFVEDSQQFRVMEANKLKRIFDWMKQPQDPAEQIRNQKNFYHFFLEHDRRRGTDFVKTFPEMIDFWEHCQRLSLMTNFSQSETIF